MPTLNTLEVRVFRNLTKGCYSIQAKVGKGWRTVAHADAVLIEPATFKVSEAGRQRTIATGRKQVHAWVCGRLVMWAGAITDAIDQMGLDPRAVLKSARRITPGVGATPADVAVLFDRATAIGGHLRETLRYNPRKGESFTVALPGFEHLAGRSVTMARAVLLHPAGMVSGSAV